MQVKYCVKKHPKYLLANLVHCIKKGTNFGGHRVILFNLANPTRYPWYKEKFPALKDTDLHKLLKKERFRFIFYQLQILVKNRSIKQI